MDHAASRTREHATANVFPEGMTENGSFQGEDGSLSLALLLQSCASITEKALSCRTLGLAPNRRNRDVAALIQDEVELAEWLDRHILEYRATLASHGRHPPEDTNDTQLQARQIRFQQQELLDESIRRQQEHILLSRIAMSSTVQESIFPQSHIRSIREQSEGVLRQEAIRSRDEQVRISLDKLRELSDIHGQLQAVTDESHRFQSRNRTIWHQIGSHDSTAASLESSPGTRIAAENLILKRVLQDMIVGSDLDWYKDERLRDTMMKVES